LQYETLVGATRRVAPTDFGTHEASTFHPTARFLPPFIPHFFCSRLHGHPVPSRFCQLPSGSVRSMAFLLPAALGQMAFANQWHSPETAGDGEPAEGSILHFGLQSRQHSGYPRNHLCLSLSRAVLCQEISSLVSDLRLVSKPCGTYRN